MSSHPSPGPSTQSISSRHKQKTHTVGIAAGAEDAKYQGKYKDLKRKVKDIETDNDKLHFKVLQAKRSIQRMKLERAILYERLSGIAPPLSDVHDRHTFPPPPIHLGTSAPPLPPSRSHSGTYHTQDLGDHRPPQDIPGYHLGYDRNYIPRNEGPLASIMPIGPGMTPTSHMSGMHSPPRRNSDGAGQESMRHSQQLPLPPVPHMDGSHSHSHSRSHVSPTLHHSHSGSSPERTRSHSSSRSRARHESVQPYNPGHTHPQQYPEGLPSVQQVLHSPSLSARETRERQRRPPMRTDSHKHGRLSSFMPRLSPPPPSAEARSVRVHSHQRVGPGSYINRDDHYERQRDIDREREREWEREREQRDRERRRDVGGGRDANSSHMLSPPIIPRRSRPLLDRDYQEHHISSRMHEEQYYRDPIPGPGGYPIVSRSGSPGSGSGSGSGNGAGEAPSRPESRTPYYEQPERTRSSSYRLRPVNQPNEDLDFVHEDGRSMSSRDRGSGGGGTFPPQEQSRSSLESRKRGRNDMDVDSDDAGDGPMYSSGRVSEDRGSKRYHREPRRSVDNQEDGRMGPP